jgi:hypothetical protein
MVAMVSKLSQVNQLLRRDKRTGLVEGDWQDKLRRLRSMMVDAVMQVGPPAAGPAATPAAAGPLPGWPLDWPPGCMGCGGHWGLLLQLALEVSVSCHCPPFPPTLQPCLPCLQEPLVILIKLGDRLHNMRTVYALPPEKQQAVAEETLHVWCTMAEYLGWHGLKSEMEDLCFAVLQTEVYCRLRLQLDRLWNVNTMPQVGQEAGCLEGGGFCRLAAAGHS